MRYFVTAVYLILFSILFALWFEQAQAQSYFKGPYLIQTPSVVTTAAGTTTLTNASNTRQVFTGSSTQTVVLPDATTLSKGVAYEIVNQSSGSVTVRLSDSSSVVVLGSGQNTTLFLQNNSTSAGTWATDFMLSVTGVLPVANGGTGTSTQFTPGSVVFAGSSGVYTQDNANFFWDDSNNRLGIGTTSPSNPLHIYGAGASTSIATVENSANGATEHALINIKVASSGAGDPKLSFIIPSSNTWSLGIDNSDSDKFAISNDASVDTAQKLTIGTNGVVSFLQGYETGVVISSAAGVLSSQALSLSAAPSSYLTGALPIGAGGTGQTTKAAAFDALSPMTNAGDLIYGGASGTGTRLAPGSSGQILTSGGTGAPSWITTVPIANGGTNNGSLSVSAGAAYYADGTKLVALAPGSSGQFYTSGGTGAATWTSATMTTYTPTITNGTNVAASTTRAGTYIRLGSIVHLCFSPNIDPTSTGLTDIGVSIPVASDFTTDLTDLSGMCVWVGGSTNANCNCYADTTNDRATCAFSAATTADASTRICFQYVIK